MGMATDMETGMVMDMDMVMVTRMMKNSNPGGKKLLAKYSAGNKVVELKMYFRIYQ